MIAEQKELLKKFFKALDCVSHGPGEIYDLGLIISDDLKSKDLIKFMPRPNEVEAFIFSEKTDSREFLKALMSAFENKKWLIINLQGGHLSSEIYSQLRLLSTNNRMQLSENEIINDIKMPKESRIIVLTDKESMAKINNPNFINLFSPVINI